jgi:hypothetical protein
MATLLAACDFRVIDIGLVNEAPEVMADLTSNKTRNYCPGEVITVTWYGGTMPDGCPSGGSDYNQCKHSEMVGVPFGLVEFYGFDPDYLYGSRSFRMPPEVNLVGFRYTVGLAGETRSDTLMLRPFPVTNVYQNFDFVCDPATNTYQLNRGELYMAEDGRVAPLSLPEDACIAVTGFESPWDPAIITDPDGRTIPSANGQTLESEVDGYTLDDLSVMPAGPFGPSWRPAADSRFAGADEWSDIVGMPCTPGDPRDRRGAYGDAPPYSFITYSVGCVENPADIRDAAARAACQNRYVSTAPLCEYDAVIGTCYFSSVQSIEIATPTASQNTGNDGPVAICDLSQSCGDGECESLCENTASCPADCAVSTEAPQECGPGWLPPSGCTCCTSTLVCADGSIGEFNPACTGGGDAGGQPPVCGDGVCGGGEACWSCSADCGPC